MKNVCLLQVPPLDYSLHPDRTFASLCLDFFLYIFDIQCTSTLPLFLSSSVILLCVFVYAFCFKTSFTIAV